MKKVLTFFVAFSAFAMVSCQKNNLADYKKQSTDTTPTLRVVGAEEYARIKPYMINADTTTPCIIEILDANGKCTGTTVSVGLSYFVSPNGNMTQIYFDLVYSSNVQNGYFDLYMRKHSQGTNLWKVLKVAAPQTSPYDVLHYAVMLPASMGQLFDLVARGVSGCSTRTNTYFIQ